MFCSCSLIRSIFGNVAEKLQQVLKIFESIAQRSDVLRLALACGRCYRVGIMVQVFSDDDNENDGAGDPFEQDGGAVAADVGPLFGPVDEHLLQLLSSGCSVAKSAELAAVSVSTVRRRLKSPRFLNELRRRTRERYEFGTRTAAASMGRVVEFLKSVIFSDVVTIGTGILEVDVKDRLSAARQLQELAAQNYEYDLVAQLDELTGGMLNSQAG